MNWDKIDIKAIMELLREVEERKPILFGDYSVLYSDGIEELEIIYRRLR